MIDQVMPLMTVVPVAIRSYRWGRHPPSPPNLRVSSYRCGKCRWRHSINQEANMPDDAKQNSAAEDIAKWCFTWDPTDQPGSGRGKMALELKNKWPKAATINVAFLDGEK